MYAAKHITYITLRMCKKIGEVTKEQIRKMLLRWVTSKGCVKIDQ